MTPAMSRILDRVVGGSATRRGLLVIMGGVAGGQVLALLASPVLGRVFPPEVYGPFAVINAAVLPLGNVAALRLEFAIALPYREGMARDVARLGLQICSAVGLIGAALVWLARFQLASALGQGRSVAELLPWVPFIAGEIGAFTVLNQLAIRQREYGAIGRRSLLQAATTIVVQIGLGLAGFRSQGLAIGMAVGLGVGVATLASSTRTRPGGQATVHAPPGHILRRFKSFPLLVAPAGLLNSVGIQAPVLLASALFGVEVSGWLGMTQRILALPLALLGTTLAQVYLGEFGQARREARERMLPLFIRTSKRLAIVGVVLAAVVIILGPVAFSVVLGPRWETSGSYARALAVGLVLQMVAAPLSQTLIVMEKNFQQFVWDVIRLTVCAAAVLGGYRMGWSPIATMWLLGLATAVTYAWLWGMSWRAVTKSTATAYPAGRR